MCSAVLCFLIPLDHAANTSVRVFLGALRSFVFRMLSCHAALCAYILGSVQQVRYGIPMRNCVHCFVCVSCSVALRNPTVATPLLREYTLFINGVAFSWTALTRCPRILQLHLLCGVLFFLWAMHVAHFVVHVPGGKC